MQLNLEKGFGLFFKTMPIILVRLGVNLLALVLSLLYFGFIAMLISKFSGAAGIIGIIGFIVFIGLFRLLKMYLIYLVKGAHVAVITAFIMNEEIPEGKSQFTFGKEKVISHFKEVSIFFLLDRLVAGVIRAINSTLMTVSGLIPLPGLKDIMRVVQGIIKYSLTYIDEAVLSYAMVRGDENFWKSAKDGLILYFQSWKKIIGSGIKLLVMSVLFLFAVGIPLLLIYLPFSRSLSSTMDWLVIAGIIGFALVLKAAFFDSLAMTMMIVDYHIATKDQTPSPEIEAKLEKISRKFREIKKRAFEAEPSPAPADA